MTELPLDVNDEDADEDVPAVAARLTELNKLAFLELILLLPLLLCRYLDMTIGSALCPLSGCLCIGGDRYVVACAATRTTTPLHFVCLD